MNRKWLWIILLAAGSCRNKPLPNQPMIALLKIAAKTDHNYENVFSPEAMIGRPMGTSSWARSKKPLTFTSSCWTNYPSAISNNGNPSSATWPSPGYDWATGPTVSTTTPRSPASFRSRAAASTMIRPAPKKRSNSTRRSLPTTPMTSNPAGSSTLPI